MMTSTRKKKGFALMMLITAIFLAVILASTLYILVYLNSTLFRAQYYIKQAYYAGCSGSEYAIFIIKNSTTYNPLNPGGGSGKAAWPKGQSFDPFGDGSSVTVNITQPGGFGTDYTIQSTGTVNGQNKTVYVTTYTTGAIKSWK